jgi:hypothetical protein
VWVILLEVALANEAVLHVESWSLDEVEVFAFYKVGFLFFTGAYEALVELVLIHLLNFDIVRLCGFLKLLSDVCKL